MRLSGPAPNFAKAGAFLAKQAFEGINVLPAPQEVEKMSSWNNS